MPLKYPNLSWPDGQPLNENWVLFVAAPEQIGAPRIATTTFRRSDQVLRGRLRLIVPWAVPISCAVITYFASLRLADAMQRGMLIGAALISAPLWTWLLYQRVSRFHHTLVYLSENGVACFECTGSPENFTRRELLLFSQATALFTKQNSSVYEFLWKDPQDRLVFRWEGRFAVPGIEVPRSHIFQGLKAAERAWTSFFVEDATQQLERGGSVSFVLLGQGTLRMTSTQLTWNASEKTHMLNHEDIETFQCDSQTFAITPSYKGESKGFAGLKIAVEHVGNLKALTTLLTRYFTIKGQ